MVRQFPIQASRRPASAETLSRAAFAHAVRAFTKLPLDKILEGRWPDDTATATIAKAAVGPADTATPAWAGALARQAIGDYVTTLGSPSATSQVVARAVRANLDGVNSLLLPRRATPPAAGDVPWIGEGNPAPLKKFALTGGAQLGPGKKLFVLVAATNELMSSSSAEQVFEAIMRESVAFSLDATFFSNQAATADQPAGILNGIAVLTATAGGGETAQAGDLEKLAAGVADNVDDVVLIAHPRQALSLRIRRPDLDIPVFSTRAIAAGTIIMLDPQGIAFGYGTDPRFEASTESVIHAEDTTPLPISTAGTPNTVAAPVQSLFQTDCTAISAKLPMAWAIRQPGAVAWISGATWG